MRRKFVRRVASVVCLLNMFSNGIVASALTTVSGYVSINNSTDTDYKTTKDLMFNIAGEIKTSSDYKEIINYDENQKLSSDSVLNYLIQNNLLSSDLNIDYDGIKVSTEVVDKFDFRSNDSVIKKSDFLATLGKALYGVKESRTLVFNTKSIRWVDGSQQILYLTDQAPDGYEGSDTEFDYSNGDYSIFVTPNVYEMYFKDLVSSGVVSLDEFSDSIFIESYKTYGSTVNSKRVLPAWSESLGNYDVLSSTDPSGYSIQSSSSVLGSGFEITKDGFKVSVTNKDTSWFFDEDLLTIDALGYIEKALRANEKEMTETEANIITYKYGVKYLEKVPSEYRSTVKFLIAKGILNFENEEEFTNLFKPLSGEFFRTLIYRVHNKDARFDFSSVQLTDSDNYWLSKGFSETTINFYEGSAPEYDTEVEEVTNAQTSSAEETPSLSNLFGLLSSRQKVIADSVKNKEYVVTRVFKTSSNKYYYNGTELNSNTKVEDPITEVVNDKANNLLKVKFKVKANSSVAAVAIVDANLTVKNTSGLVSVGTIPAVAYSESGDGETKVSDCFIPQSVLNSLNGFPIFVSEDKYLINKETGARALILEDSKKALIGNHVFNMGETMIYGLNGEVYYNLELIKYLLSEAMLSSLDNGDLFYTKGYVDTEKSVQVKNSSGSVIDTLYMRELYHRVSLDISSGEDNPTKDWFFNISQSNSLSNYLIYDISKEVKSEEAMNMIIEFKYVFPDSADVGIDSSFIEKYKNSTLTTGDVYNYLYKRPSTKTLQSWWDSNITFSNALVNYIMGTEGVQYVKSGFLMPTITVLGDLSEKNSDDRTYYDALNSVLENSIGLSESFLSSVKSNTTRDLDFIKSYFNYQSNFLISSGDSALDGLIYQREFQYFAGVEGRYKKSTNLYEKSNYTDYYEYCVMESNGNIYQVQHSSTYFEKFDEKAKVIYIRDTPGLKYSPTPNISKGSVYYVDSLSNNGDYDSYTCISTSNGQAQLALGERYAMYYVNGNLTLKSDGSGSFEDYLKEFGDLRFGSGNYSVPDDSSLYPAPNLGEFKKGYYRIGDKYYYVKKDGGTIDLKDYLSDKEVSKLEGKRVYVFPSVVLDTKIYSYDTTTRFIKKVNNDPRYVLRNVTNVGIVSNIIDSIVFNNSNYVTLSQIPNNAKVVIGYNVYEKIGGYLQSPVVSGSEVIGLNGMTLIAGEFPDQFKSIVSKHIGDIPIVSKGFTSLTGQFMDYVKDLKFGKGQSDSKYDRTLKLNDKGTLIVTETIISSTYSKDTAFNSFCYAFKLKDGVIFKEIGDTGRYTLVPISNTKVDGDLSNSSYFQESLSYSDSESMIAGLVGTEYRPASRLSEFAEAILKAYDAQRIDDFTGLISYLIRLVCTWLIGANTVLLVLRNDVLDSLVYEFKYPRSKRFGNVGVGSSSNRFRFDIYSVLTLGLQNVDSKTSLLKGLVVSGVLFVIAALLSIGYFG